MQGLGSETFQVLHLCWQSLLNSTALAAGRCASFLCAGAYAVHLNNHKVLMMHWFMYASPGMQESCRPHP